MPAWLWWTVGWCVSVMGMALLLWALFRDRSRGRRRCPKCWYDLSATPGARCSECGYEARREKQLFRTRRQWGWAAIGSVLALAGVGGAYSVNAANAGWIAAMPNWFLIGAFERDYRLAVELESRANLGELRSIESWWWVWRCTRTLEAQEPLPDVQQALMILCDLQEYSERVGRDEPWITPLRPSKVGGERFVRAVGRLTDHQVNQISIVAGHLLSMCAPEARSAIPKYLGALTDPLMVVRGHGREALAKLRRGAGPVLQAALAPPREVPARAASERDRIPSSGDRPGTPVVSAAVYAGPAMPGDNQCAFLRGLSRLEMDTPAYGRAAIAGLRSDDPSVRWLAAGIIAVCWAGKIDARDPLLGLADDPNENVRDVLVEALTLFPPSERSVEFLAEMIEREPGHLRKVEGLGSLGRRFLPKLEANFELSPRDVDWGCLGAYEQIGGDAERPCRALILLLEEAQINPDLFLQVDSALINWKSSCLECPDAVMLAESFSRSMYSYIGDNALVVFAQLGGSRSRAESIFLKRFQGYRDGGGFSLSFDISMYSSLVRSGLLSPTVILPLFEGADARECLRLLGCIESLGDVGWPLLPAIRPYVNHIDPAVARAAKLTVKRIEWEIANPEKAARLRNGD